MRVIHIQWEGHFSFDEIKELNKAHDYGIYQFYGCHPVYGSDVLLYIGKAEEQTFSERIIQQKIYWEGDNKINVYIGRLAGNKTPNNEEWGKQINLAEKLLIHAHAPAYNSMSISSIPDAELQDIHILNWGTFNNLLPEISGSRWTNKYYEMPNYDVFGKH